MNSLFLSLTIFCEYFLYYTILFIQSQYSCFALYFFLNKIKSNFLISLFTITYMTLYSICVIGFLDFGSLMIKFININSYSFVNIFKSYNISYFL